MRKVLFVTLTLAPYKVKWMEGLSEDFDVSIYYTREFDKERHSDWLIKTSSVLKLIKGLDVFGRHGFSMNLFNQLWQSRKDIIIFDGYGFLTQFMGLLMCRLLNIKHYVNVDGGIRVKNENLLHVLIKRILISKQSFYLVSSAYTKKYLKDYGVSDDHIHIHPFTSLMQTDILNTNVNDEVKAKLRSDLGMESKFQVLCVSQTIHRKGIDVLLEAMNGLQNIHLTVVGGQCRDEYTAIIKKYDLSVNFIPYLSYEQLKNYYQAVDLFVLPTRYDVWGLVINEAMANGLPVLTTTKCGAGLALLDEECLVKPDDLIGLRKKIEQIQKDNSLRKKLAKQSIERIQSYSIENVAALHRKLFSEN